MATGTAVIVGAALAAGAAGGATFYLLAGPGPGPVSYGPDAGGDLAALELRLSGQEEEIRDLRGRLDEALRARPAPLPDGGFPGHPGEGAPGDPDGWDPGESDTGPEGFEARFRKMREKEQEKTRRVRAEETEASLRSRLERNTKLDLTEEQKDGVVKALLERGRKLREVFEEAREQGTPESFSYAQERAGEIRTETRTVLEGILTADQLKVLESPDRQGRPGRFGGRPGGGREGGGREREGGGGRRGGGRFPPR